MRRAEKSSSFEALLTNIQALPFEQKQEENHSHLRQTEKKSFEVNRVEAVFIDSRCHLRPAVMKSFETSREEVIGIVVAVLAVASVFEPKGLVFVVI